nr:MAG TPA: redox-sensing transcriptional repressor [Caudoviricetes sp.]
MNNKEKLLLVSNILKNILDREYVSSYKLAKTIGLSEKTVKKIFIKGVILWRVIKMKEIKLGVKNFG